VTSPGRTLRSLALLLALLAGLPGCALLSAAFDPPKLHFDSWAPENLDLEGVTIALKYRVENPNSAGFRLSKVNWALDLDGRPAAKGDMPAGLQVPARGVAPLTIPVRLRWRDLPDIARLVGREEVAFKVAGNAAVASPVGDVNLPFSKEGRLPVPKPPGVAIENVRIKDLSPTNLSLDLQLRVTNQNRFPLPVGALAWGLRLGGDDVAKGNGHPLAAVPPGGSAKVTVPVRLSLVAAADAIQRLLRGGEVPVAVDGQAEFGGMRFPFEDQSSVEKQPAR
jgi:LEA14-like dessication related protein